MQLAWRPADKAFLRRGQGWFLFVASGSHSVFLFLISNLHYFSFYVKHYFAFILVNVCRGQTAILRSSNDFLPPMRPVLDGFRQAIHGTPSGSHEGIALIRDDAPSIKAVHYGDHP